MTKREIVAAKKKKKNGKTAPKDEPRLPVPTRKSRSKRSKAEPISRQASVQRRTKETDVSVVLDLDGSGQSQIDTRVPFFDHMLQALAKHSLIDLKIHARGDIEVDPHHTVEDVGICIGRALVEAMGDRAGMRRYGEATLPFDEALVRAHIDLCGRSAFIYKVDIPIGRVGSFDAELCEVFFRALADEGRMNLHLISEYGQNRHHLIEGCFKSFARALERALSIDPRRHGDVASTKGQLD
jgi:imidazoleglycerol-phosphate dehydratase